MRARMNTYLNAALRAYQRTREIVVPVLRRAGEFILQLVFGIMPPFAAIFASILVASETWVVSPPVFPVTNYIVRVATQGYFADAASIFIPLDVLYTGVTLIILFEAVRRGRRISGFSFIFGILFPLVCLSLATLSNCDQLVHVHDVHFTWNSDRLQRAQYAINGTVGSIFLLEFFFAIRRSEDHGTSHLTPAPHSLSNRA